MRCLVWLLCFYCATAHVKDFGREHAHISIQHSEGKADLSSEPSPAVWEPLPAVSSLRGTEANAGKLDSLYDLPKRLKGQCQWMGLALLFICCCGGLLQETLGREAASQISCFISFFVFFYLMFSGIYSAYWKGEHVGVWCKILCWWAIFAMCCWGMLCCGMCAGLGLMLGIKNVAIKKMKEDYEERMQHISGPRRDFYESDFFKKKCDQSFEKADKDGSGTLDMKELQAVLVDALGQDIDLMQVALLQEAFEEHGDSVVEKHEFCEMMKFISVVTLQEGKVNLKQAFEILQCPETATKSEVRKAYYKLAQKYHPDKRTGGDPETIKRDMAEINDANACIEEHFKEKEKDNATK